ncbi:MAG TPA: hypothetical protein VK577_03620 [Bradyrhizobium sp.]|nr:hypothetical protein [Bradyrhizobium sp.]
MIFRVGQAVVCVDASLAANPWHRRHPLIKNRIYMVHSLTKGIGCVDIDGSGRAWQNWRFRPASQLKTETFFTEGAPADTKGLDNRHKRKQKVWRLKLPSDY